MPDEKADIVGLITLTTEEITSQNNEAIRHLKQAVSNGKNWFIALLEAISLWTAAEETFQNRHFQYLIGGEAFDWLLLAQRLLLEIEGQFPQDEAEALLFESKAPLNLSASEFRRLIGAAKSRAHLNFLYGVVVEETLYLAVIEEVRKERRSIGLGGEVGVEEEADVRLYGNSRQELLDTFRIETGHSRRRHLDLEEMNEFTYWLFKLRLKQWDPSRVASDTRKGLDALHQHWTSSKLNQGNISCLFWPPSPGGQVAPESAPAYPAE